MQSAADKPLSYTSCLSSERYELQRCWLWTLTSNSDEIRHTHRHTLTRTHTHKQTWEKDGVIQTCRGRSGLKPSMDKGDCSVAIFGRCAIWRQKCVVQWFRDVCVCVFVCVRACRSCQALIMQLFNHRPTPFSFPPCCFLVFILSLLSFQFVSLPFHFSSPGNFGSLLFSLQSVPLFCHICQASSSLSLTPIRPFSHFKRWFLSHSLHCLLPKPCVFSTV